MVGLWSPEPPADPSNEHLTPQNSILMPVVTTSEDEDEDDTGYDGYELMYFYPSLEDDSALTDTEDTEDELTETAVTCSVEADDQEVQGNVEQEGSNQSRDQEIRELWSSPSNRSTIEMGEEQTAQILAAMANITLPPSAIPSWASVVPEEQWKQQLIDRIQNLQKSHSTDDPV